MRYLIDSDVMIDLIEGRVNAVDFLDDDLFEGTLAISAVTYAELYTGVSRSDYPSRAQARIEHFVVNSGSDVVPLSAEAARLAGHINGSLKKIGSTTGLLDVMNAAIAIVHDCTLVTRNVRHYERVPNLKFVSPTET